MKKIFLLISAVLLIVPMQAQYMLRLMIYNIRNATSMDDVCDFQRIANVINNASLGVVVVQEVDSVTNWNNQKYVLGEITEWAQIYVCLAPAIDYDSEKCGISLLLKRAPVRLQTIALPGREEVRALILAESEDYIYCCTHLSLTEEDRMRSLEIPKTFAASYKKPLFLAGDMNAEPGSDFIRELQKGFRILSNPKQRTFPAPAPEETIDYVVVFKQDGKGFVVVSLEVVDKPAASDHRSTVMELCTAEETDKIFRIKPYLQNPVGSGMTVTWETTIPAYCWVEYGTSATQSRRACTIANGQVACNNKLYKIRLDGLQLGQKYYYCVCS